jgi:hypothetical protein
MSKKKTKYLVETSAVPPAIGESTPAHCQHFRDEVADGRLFTSVYVRKEFIRRWVLDRIDVACRIDHFSDVPTALRDLSHDYGRKPKGTVDVIASILNEKGRIDSTRSMAKEIARLAVSILKKFDYVLRARANDSTGCKIGAHVLTVDYNHLFDDLRDFVKSVGNVTDCPVNEFLGFSRPRGNAPRLLEVPDVQKKTEAGKHLATFAKERKWIECRECASIGDAVIALDQPPSWCLLHIDHAFKLLCVATRKPNKPILSERAVETDVPRITK